MLWQFVALLAVHWVADFCLQTHWQASNKSSNNTALIQYVGVYTCALFFATPIIFPGADFSHARLWTEFVVLNGVLHFATDYATSRVNSKLFADQLETIIQHSSRGWPDRERTALAIGFNPHNFFVSVGFDQLIHQITLAATAAWIFGG